MITAMVAKVTSVAKAAARCRSGQSQTVEFLHAPGFFGAILTHGYIMAENAPWGTGPLSDQPRSPWTGQEARPTFCYNRVARMSTVNGQPRLTVAELAARCRGQLIPLDHTFSYFCTPSMAEEDLRQYLHDPIAALSPAICTELGTVGLVLVPYLEKGNGRTGDMVSFEKPAEGRQLTASRARPAT